VLLPQTGPAPTAGGHGCCWFGCRRPQHAHLSQIAAKGAVVVAVEVALSRSWCTVCSSFKAKLDASGLGLYSLSMLPCNGCGASTIAKRCTQPGNATDWHRGTSVLLPLRSPSVHSLLRADSRLACRRGPKVVMSLCAAATCCKKQLGCICHHAPQGVPML